MLSTNKNYSIIIVLLLIMLYLDGFGCTTKDSSIVQLGKNTAIVGMPDKCQNILDIKHEDNFEVIKTPSGVEIEVLYSFWNSKS
ncbi:MAG: hypothetical protein HOC24_11005, partial [Deltaproteobacteria bacterium]|nr:hypothetical protein [Deltaproteobacteria bacterium]